MNETKVFVDTNILVYAHDSSENEKHTKAQQIFKECYEGNRQLAFSTQTLSEFFAVITRKIKKPVSTANAQIIISTILNFNGMTTTVIQPDTILAATQTHKTTGVHYWDCLIAETAKANGIHNILTENTKDFKKISGIKAKNPFK
ncbi:PIN domain-containing protein [Candidatus Micrarchaeota archaeon]|nr:PIN domain-containing protein [Candidatus Micrarchaeota archaeon]MBU1930292.1 PIN domain-containing protein [Candidatus Micrarchaeota archaeon]